MKHWQETQRILDRLLLAASQGRPSSLAVVVRIVGSAYRRPGARLLIERDGATLGGVSGGCLEADVRQVGLDALGSGECRLLHYETGSDDTKVWGLGLGCNGSVDVFVQPVVTDETRAFWGRVRRRLQGDEPFSLSLVVDGPGAGRAAIVGDVEGAALGPGGLFTEQFVPPPRLVICGAGDDALALSAAATAVGLRVVVVDHRPAFLAGERFPEARARHFLRPDDDHSALRLDRESLAVVMTHSFRHDREWVRRLLATDVPYIGLLGPRARAQKILSEVGGPRRERVYGPVGLDLGADGPEQVALSIVAEILAVCASREPRHLREKEEAVHA